jgi:agmatinase
LFLSGNLLKYLHLQNALKACTFEVIIRNCMNSLDQPKPAFDPDGVGNTGGNIFGLPFKTTDARVVILPVPWDVTVSNHDGTSAGPANILNQSPQIDLYDEMVHEPWKAGIAMEEIPQDLIKLNNNLRLKAKAYINQLEEGNNQLPLQQQEEFLHEVNTTCESLCEKIRQKSLDLLNKEKLVVLVGGDHSTPLGLIKALSEVHSRFGILQIDAHADLRDAYMGFHHSHASIMFNASQIPAIASVVQIGLRDVSQKEADFIKRHSDRFHAWFARDLHRLKFEGETWRTTCSKIISQLPEKVYISFDIDGLDTSQCLSTGTPVPGGLTYSEVIYLFEQVVASGRTIIGFDLVETGPDPLDGVVACRLLYKTIAMMLKSNNLV